MMFNNRAHTEITKAEMEQTQKALQKLEQAYSNNRMTKAMFLSRRERLVKNLERVVSSNTPLFTNPEGFYGRNELDLSIRPMGYKESLQATQELDGQKRKVSESKIRRAALENAMVDEADTASIMDALQANATPNNFQAALQAVNQMQTSKLLGGTKQQMTLAGVWSEISDTPSITKALAKLREAVRARVEVTIAEGMPISAAENYILSNARNAGAVLTKEGYDRSRAANLVKSVINGEMSVIAAQNMVSADLRDATNAVISPNANFETQPTVSPNAAKVNTEAMPIKELVEVREAAINTLADPLAFQEELDWAASFVEQANTTLKQRANQIDTITGNSTYQIKVSTEPALNQNNAGDGLPMPIIEQTPVMQPPRPQTTQEAVQNISSLSISQIYQSDALPVMINQNLPENNGYAEMVRRKEEEAAMQRELELQKISQREAENARRIAQEAAQAQRIAQEAARKEAAEKARQEAALAAKKAANAAAKKAANEARRAKEASLKAQKEEEARQAKLIEQQKKKEAEEAAHRAFIANAEKREALALATKLAQEAKAEAKRVANAARFQKIANAEAARKIREAEEAARTEAMAKKAKEEALRIKKEANNLARKLEAEAKRTKEAAMKAKLEEEAKKAKLLENQKQKEAEQAARLQKIALEEKKKKLAEAKKIEQAMIKEAPVSTEVSYINQPMTPPVSTEVSYINQPTAIVKPGPVKNNTTKPNIFNEIFTPQEKNTKQTIISKPINKRTPAEKVANALARLPSQNNVNRFRKQRGENKSMKTTTGQRLWRKPVNEPLRGVRRSSTSTTTSHPEGHDPRALFRDDMEGGLGASTSTTTSSRTSGAYRFQDPRYMHRWG